MRAFLREPSTPWIVFDQDGRPPSQVAVFEVMPRAFSSEFPESFFPPGAAMDLASQAKLEPSSVSVASDLMREPAVGCAASATPPSRLTRRIIGGAAVGVVTLAISVLALHSASHSIATAPPVAAAQNLRTQDAPVPADLPPPELTPAAPVAVSVATVATPAATPPVSRVTPADDQSSVKSSARKFARLSIAGEARSRDVYMDGKRLLGKGARSYTVNCGGHTIAVGSKSDLRHIDFACTGSFELVLTK